MKLKQALKIAVAMLLVLCMLLPVLASCKKPAEDPNDDPNTPSTPSTPSTTPETNLSTCTHAVTTLKNVRAASCDEEGYTGDKVCTSCGAVITAGTAIAKTAHVYDAGQVTKRPTCIETGVTTFTCTGCGTTKTEPIDKVPHSDVYHDAYDGGHTHTCEHCTMNEYAAHTPTDEGTYYPASCLEAAYTEYTCADCGGIYKVYSEAEGDQALGHDWGEWTVTMDATCIAVGSKSHICQRGGCGTKDSIEIPVVSTAHSWYEDYRDEATCVAEGAIYYICIYCEEPKTETIAKLAHALGEPEVAGDGWTHQHCTNGDYCDYKVSTFDASTQDNASVKTNDVSADRNLSVNMSTANMEFPKELVSTMTETKDADIAINAGVVENKDALLEKVSDPAQKDRLTNVDIYDFGVSVNGSPLDFAGNTVTVTLPYELGTDEDPEGILIWYVADDGTIQSYPAVYDAETKTVTFEAEHFSYYAIAYEETQAMKCKRGIHDPIKKETIEASCMTYGYTVYECSCCHHIELDDIVAKLNHAYGEVVEPTVSCVEGGYVTRTCQNEGCGDVVYLEYRRATGHTVTTTATCTAGTVCTTCKQTVAPARGHDYTEWTVVVEPTDIKQGLRRRYCLRCGEMEEVKLAATGNITKLDFNSFEDVFELLLKDTLGFENGTISFETVVDGVTITADITLDKEEAGYIALINAMESYTYNGEECYYKYQVLYRNGMLFMVEEDSDGPASMVESGNLEALMDGTIDLYLDALKLGFDDINPFMEEYFEQLDAALLELNEAAGAQIDSALEAEGISYRMADMLATLDSLKTLYAYTALKLGCSTGIGMEDGVEVPTLGDLLTLADAFMTKTESAGRTDYTIDTAPFMEALDTILTWLENEADTPLSALLWQLIGTDVTAAYPEITDWAGMMAKLQETYTGETTVSDLMDDVITLLESNEICTIEEFYAAIDAMILEETGEAFDSEAYITENGDVTLDEMASAMAGGTMADIYGMLDSYFAITLGEFPVPELGTVNDFVAMMRQYLAAIDPTFSFSFAIDAEGNLLALDFSGDVLTKLPEDADPAEEPVQLFTATLSLKGDSSVTVQLPDVMTPVKDVKIESSFDAAGNLIVTVPEGYEINFELGGSVDAALKDKLVVDTKVSEAFGYTVYRLPESMWTNTEQIGTYISYNGKYYTYHYDWDDGYQTIKTAVSLADVMADPTLLLPATDAAPYGYYQAGEAYLPIYRTALGYAAEVEGAWCLLKNCRHDSWFEETDAEGNWISGFLYTFEQAVDYAAAMAGLELSNFSSYGAIDYNGTQVRIGYGYFYLDVELWGSETVSTNMFILDDTLYFYTSEYAGGNSYYVLDEEIATLPTHDTQSKWQTGNTVVAADGTTLTGTVYMVELRVSVPTYYMQVADGIYVSLDSYYLDSVSTAGRETVSLLDGNTLYVKERLNETDEEGTYNNLITGYVKLPSGQCIHTVAYYMNETFVKVVYREASETATLYFSEFFDVDDYVTKTNDSTYRISAALFTELKALCTEQGDMYTLHLSGIREADGMEYAIYCLLEQYYILSDSIEAMIGGGRDYGIDWDQYFRSNGISSDFSLIVNDDGTLTVSHRHGGTLTLDISYYGEFPADDYLAPEAEMSRETGMDIYSAVSHFNGETYLYKDGKYYHYSSLEQVIFETVATPEEIIKQHWRIGNLYSRYITDLDQTAEGEELYPVYEGSVYFAEAYYSSSVTLYFIIKDGKLMVLTGAQNLGESILKFESYVPVTEYFASLQLTRGEARESRAFYVNGTRITMYQMNMSWSETDSEGNVVRTYSAPVYYYNSNKYIVDYEYEGSRLEIGSALDSTPTYTKLETYENTYLNGTYTFHTFKNPAKRYYVKLAGYYYDWNYYSNSYMYRSIGEYEFMKQMADKDWYYRLQLSDGSYLYYNAYDPATGTLSEPIDVLPEYAYQEESRVGSTWIDDDYCTIYEIAGYLVDSLVSEQQTDGTIFYYREGENNGWLRGQDGRYTAATKVENADGSTSILCYELAKAYLSSDMMQYNGVFDPYIYLNDDKTELTITMGLLDLIPADMADNFRISINGQASGEEYSDYLRLSYAQIEGFFGVESEEDSNDDHYFVDQEELISKFY